MSSATSPPPIVDASVPADVGATGFVNTRLAVLNIQTGGEATSPTTGRTGARCAAKCGTNEGSAKTAAQPRKHSVDRSTCITSSRFASSDVIGTWKRTTRATSSRCATDAIRRVSGTLQVALVELITRVVRLAGRRSDRMWWQAGGVDLRVKRTVRLPPELAARLRECAAQNSRSENAEIVHRLRASLEGYRR